MAAAVSVSLESESVSVDKARELPVSLVVSISGLEYAPQSRGLIPVGISLLNETLSKEMSHS